MENEVIESLAGMIYKEASKFKGYSSKEDLLQAGFLGLAIAWKNYDPSNGAKLSTYAYLSIVGEMRKLVREDKAIRPNRHMSSLKYKIEKARIEMLQTLMREPTILELSDYIGEDAEKIVECIKTSYQVQSLDEVVYSDSKDVSLEEVIPSNNYDVDMVLALNEQLNKLSPLEREILIRRYMYDQTQQEIAGIYELTQVNVSRIEHKVLQKVRKNLMYN